MFPNFQQDKIKRAEKTVTPDANQNTTEVRNYHHHQCQNNITNNNYVLTYYNIQSQLPQSITIKEKHKTTTSIALK